MDARVKRAFTPVFNGLCRRTPPPDSAWSGTFAAVGFKFDRWLDSVLMQRALGEDSATRL
jgi:hypothetical protein